MTFSHVLSLLCPSGFPSLPHPLQSTSSYLPSLTSLLTPPLRRRNSKKSKNQGSRSDNKRVWWVFYFFYGSTLHSLFVVLRQESKGKPPWQTFTRKLSMFFGWDQRPWVGRASWTESCLRWRWRGKSGGGCMRDCGGAVWWSILVVVKVMVSRVVLEDIE